jgi:glutathione synthase
MKIGIIMDPIRAIDIKKDSSFAMLLAAQTLGWDIYYMEVSDLYIANNHPAARMHTLKVADNSSQWYTITGTDNMLLQDLNIILMRKDPPVTMEYIYVTHILELAQKEGVYVVNDPAALRDANEKLYIYWFPEYIAPTLVTRCTSQLTDFLNEYSDVILKPLDGMGGASVLHIRKQDPNTGALIEILTEKNQKFIMAQKFIPEIADGDKRILLIDGDPVPYALARIPKPGEHRGNLAVGGTGKGVELTKRDLEICNNIAPALRAKGLMFVGIDIIGNYLTEINVTSPTCIRELDRIYNLDIAKDLLMAIKKNIS